MTDEAYTLMETNRDRAIVRRSARYKKGGSKSKKCNLGHEYMTRKELDAMNGECKTWKMGEFYTWEEFHQMPKDIQVEYINGLLEKYKVGVSTISMNLFGKSEKTLYNYLVYKDVYKDINTKRGGTLRMSDRVRFYEAVEQWKKSKAGIEETVEEPEVKEQLEAEIVEETVSETSKNLFNSDYICTKSNVSTEKTSFSTSYFSEVFNPYDFNFHELIPLFKGKRVHVTVSIETC